MWGKKDSSPLCFSVIGEGNAWRKSSEPPCKYHENVTNPVLNSKKWKAAIWWHLISDLFCFSPWGFSPWAIWFLMCCSEIAEYLVSWEFTLRYDESCFMMTTIKIVTFLLTVWLVQWRLEREVGGQPERKHSSDNVTWLGTGYLPVYD